MTVVSVRRDRAGDRLVVSGSHEDLLVYRAGHARVERLPMSHLPLGLGFGGVDAEHIGEVSCSIGSRRRSPRTPRRMRTDLIATSSPSIVSTCPPPRPA